MNTKDVSLRTSRRSGQCFVNGMQDLLNTCILCVHKAMLRLNFLPHRHLLLLNASESSVGNKKCKYEFD